MEKKVLDVIRRALSNVSLSAKPEVVELAELHQKHTGGFGMPPVLRDVEMLLLDGRGATVSNSEAYLVRCGEVVYLVAAKSEGDVAFRPQIIRARDGRLMVRPIVIRSTALLERIKAGDIPENFWNHISQSGSGTTFWLPVDPRKGNLQAVLTQIRPWVQELGWFDAPAPEVTATTLPTMVFEDSTAVQEAVEIVG